MRRLVTLEFLEPYREYAPLFIRLLLALDGWIGDRGARRVQVARADR
ncbi:MAG: hypothetical protein H0U67_00275 [Gemmatimonadetes bacterium]|nr:hypothetical protein [Gemmatimonadota bacterium]